MQAVILCGGKGTRISNLYPDRPKALVPVCGKPFIEWQLEWLHSYGVADVHLATGHMSTSIHGWLTSSRFKSTTTLSAEPHPLDTGGALKFVQPHLRSDPFLALNGDGLLPNLNLHTMRAEHRQHGVMVTIAVTHIKDTAHYGWVEVSQDKRISSFHEKTHKTKGWINGGVYLINHSVLNDLDANRTISLETQLFPQLAQRGLIAAYTVEPPLLDMGTPEGIKIMERFLNK